MRTWNCQLHNFVKSSSNSKTPSAFWAKDQSRAYSSHIPSNNSVGNFLTLRWLKGFFCSACSLGWWLILLSLLLMSSGASFGFPAVGHPGLFRSVAKWVEGFGGFRGLQTIACRGYKIIKRHFITHAMKCLGFLCKNRNCYIASGHLLLKKVEKDLLPIQVGYWVLQRSECFSEWIACTGQGNAGQMLLKLRNKPTKGLKKSGKVFKTQ